MTTSENNFFGLNQQKNVLGKIRGWTRKTGIPVFTGKMSSMLGDTKGARGGEVDSAIQGSGVDRVSSEI